jgi:EAL domain-containing protein (putative c-di-GMP-specific phosphodiesterase class I)/DNA-binding response OmpR family regulator
MTPASEPALEVTEEPTPTVLVIDDDPDLREFYTTALRRAGFEILTAPDGERGLEILESWSVGLVLCDVSMPGMSGFDVVRALRAAPDTSTLPIILITGSGDSESLIEGLSAGADDFLSTPVRLDELEARVRAHIRTHEVWLGVVGEELRKRVAVVSTLARIRPSSNPEEVAEAITTELARRPDTAFVGVFQVSPGSRGRILASSLGSGSDLEALAPSPRRMRYLIDRARGGPWTEEMSGPEPGDPSNAFWEGGFGLMAGAPIFWNEQLVGILTMGQHGGNGPTPARVRDPMLAAVIDFAAVLSAAVGATLAARSASQAEEGRLRRILANREFDAAFQPIIDLESRAILGYEALSRFDDGTPPDVRFAEAFAAGLGPEFELAAIAHAAERAAGLPLDAFVGFNISPDVIVGSTDELRRLLPDDRPVVLEVTEHVPIADYRALRDAVGSLGDVRLAVDDAGAGFASMRHILELEPAYAKLDISLVRGINDDELRQALAAGLVYYAIRSGFQLIAEGVEQETEASILQALGVDMAQGYLFGRPAALTI